MCLNPRNARLRRAVRPHPMPYASCSMLYAFRPTDYVQLTTACSVSSLSPSAPLYLPSSAIKNANIPPILVPFPEELPAITIADLARPLLSLNSLSSSGVLAPRLLSTGYRRIGLANA